MHRFDRKSTPQDSGFIRRLSRRGLVLLAGLAGLAMLTGAVLGALSLTEEAALCALFALACVHQAVQHGTESRLDETSEVLFLILRRLDEVRGRIS